MSIKVSQENAIAALISNPTIKGAAQTAGIAEKTLHQWLKDKAFYEAYREAQAQVIRATMGQTINAAGQAIQTLTDIMTDKETNAGSRVTAAKAILDSAMKIYEAELIQERLEALERRLNV